MSLPLVDRHSMRVQFQWEVDKFVDRFHLVFLPLDTKYDICIIYTYIYMEWKCKKMAGFFWGEIAYIYIYGWIRDIYGELTTVTHGHPSVCSACRWETYQIPRRRCDNSKCIPIGSMYAIYGNMDPINIPQMLVYIPYMDPSWDISVDWKIWKLNFWIFRY